MSLPKERITYLIEAYTSKTATVQEEQELMEWMQEAQEDSELKDYVQNLWNQYQPETKFDYVNWDDLFNRIIQSDKIHSIAPEPKRILWPRIVAAAAVLIVLGTASYFLLFHKVSKNEIAKTEIKDVVPPSAAKAMITLADGRQIVLDSAANGTLALQANVKLVKHADGEVSYSGTSGEALYNTLTNPKGSKVINMTLADGSKVWLNAGSSLTFPVAFVGSERKVSITGEAYFEVAHNAAMPFKVSKDAMEVTVLGTRFNINAYNDEEDIRVTLLEGSVRTSIVNGGYSILRPGEQAIVTNDIKLVKNADVEEVMAWKNGMFAFKNASLPEIMRQAARWYDVEVIYEGRLSNERYRGEVSRSTNLSQLMKILELSGVKYKIEGKKITVKT